MASLPPAAARMAVTARIFRPATSPLTTGARPNSTGWRRSAASDEMREEFDSYLRELRRAKDQEEFDRFMRDRRNAKRDDNGPVAEYQTP